MNQTPSGLWQSARQTMPVRLLAQAAHDWYHDKTFEMGAALAYYAVFAVSPIVMMSIAVAGMFLGKEAAEGQIKEQIQSAVGPTVADAIQGMLAYTYRSGSGLWATVVGIVVLIFAATGFFSQLQSSLNTIWDVQPKPGRGIWGTVKDRFWSFLAVFGACLLLLASLLTNVALSALASILPEAQVPAGLPLWQALTLLGSFVFLTLAFALLYQFLPDAEIAWRDVWIGAAASSGLFILGNYLISLYLRWSGTSSAYGAAGSFVVILLWGFYSAQILLFGAEFTQAYARRGGKPITPRENAERADGQSRAEQDTRQLA